MNFANFCCKPMGLLIQTKETALGYKQMVTFTPIYIFWTLEFPLELLQTPSELSKNSSLANKISINLSLSMVLPKLEPRRIWAKRKKILIGKNQNKHKILNIFQYNFLMNGAVRLIYSRKLLPSWPKMIHGCQRWKYFLFVPLPIEFSCQTTPKNSLISPRIRKLFPELSACSKWHPFFGDVGKNRNDWSRVAVLVSSA